MIISFDVADLYIYMTLVISQGPDSFLISHETVEFAIIIIHGSEKCYLTLRDPTIDVICFSLPE